MKAFVLNQMRALESGRNALDLVCLPVPEPGPEEVLIRIECCGVCHTELDEIEGRSPPPVLPVIPGHQVIGIIEAKGADANRFQKGVCVGVAWIFSACGKCDYCKKGLENLCPEFQATGRDRNGGYAEFMVVPEAFAFVIPPGFSPAQAAPLLCAGAIGYRSLKLAEMTDGQSIGLCGFGASAHLVLFMVKFLFPNSRIHVFSRNPDERLFARSLGADWTGGFTENIPVKIHVIIDTTPAWKTTIFSLGQLEPSGRIIVNVLRKEENDKAELLGLNYQKHLWMEKEIKSVANITRRDVEDFLLLATQLPLHPETHQYPFAEANKALLDLKYKPAKGAKVLVL